MTKKELLENRYFQMMPDDTEIVFNTDVKADCCKPVTEDDLTFSSEISEWCKKEISGGYEPIYKYFLVINNPSWVWNRKH